ncbi:hypothetical protein [Nocardioides alcanivorans]|uniref:hypothetical protein n=1 Tax=Nocardioides alcanivorans TaxID=2897352 RepID=UPI001F194B18|nr:hypothetical protein [Nocardioides alcanivorans]
MLGGHGRLRDLLPGQLEGLGVTYADALNEGERAKGLVFDATGLTSSADLVALQQFFTPLMRQLETCARVVVLGTPPEQLEGASAWPNVPSKASPVRWARRSARAPPSSWST